MITVEDICSFSSINKADWDTLLEEVSPNYLFQTYEFHKAWWDNFGANNKKRRLLCLMAKENGRTIGIAPLMSETLGCFMPPVIKFVGTPVADYTDFLILRGREKEITGIFYEWLKKMPSLGIGLSYIPDKNSVYHEYFSVRSNVDDAPFIPLVDSWETVWGALEKELRADISRCERNLSKIGILEFCRVLNEKDIEPFLEGFFKTHIKKWKEYGSKYSQFQYKNWQDFIRELCYSLLCQGRIDMSYLKAGDNIIAYHVGFVYNGALYYYMPTYDPAYSRYSPSKLHLKHLIKWACDNKLREFDFLRGKEPYKMLWTKKTKPLFTCRSYCNNVLLRNTGVALRMAIDTYRLKLKPKMKGIKPLMSLWYRTRK